jgi:Ca2+/Na+ antiporter
MVDNSLIYHEKLSSYRTAALFLALTLLFGLLFAWQVTTSSFDTLAVLSLCFAVIFLFYTLNYTTLVVQISPQSLRLKFGIFTWTERLDNITSWTLDQLPWFLQYGGAGIHFMTAHGRYRASFNFLEYPRLVLTLKHKRGLVRDLSFSTQHPQQVIQLIQAGISIQHAQ